MFDNIIGQGAADQIIQDIKNQCLAPAMLFEGPVFSGKGSTALELGRIFSCVNDAAWNCNCPSCARHRLLLHPDLLCLGNRPFSAEIAAAASVCLAGKAGGNLTLFVRSIRKLLARFNPVLWEDEPKFSKLGPLLSSLEDGLDEIDALLKQETSNDNEASGGKSADAGKIIASIVKDAFKLESDGIPDQIPVAWIRRAAWWSRLAPIGRRKLLLVENSDRMQEGARNCLLKLLEEPPDIVSLVLTSSKPKTLMPTILSRLRPYHFARRSAETEKKVIRRIFRNENFMPDIPEKSGSPESLIGLYLDSFLPVPGEGLRALAAFFAASASYKSALILKKKGISNLPEELVLLGKFTSSLAGEAGLDKTSESRETASRIMEGALNFEIRSLFSRFNQYLLDLVLESQKTSSMKVTVVNFLEIWRKCAGEAEDAVMVYNQGINLVLEQLFIKVSRGMAEI